MDVGDGEVGAGFPYPQYMLCSRFFCPHLALPNLISPCPTSSRLTFPDPGLPWIPQGGLPGLVKKADSNLAVVEKFVAENDWIDFLATDPATRSNTSVCLSLKLSKDQINQTHKHSHGGALHSVCVKGRGWLQAGNLTPTR